MPNLLSFILFLPSCDWSVSRKSADQLGSALKIAGGCDVGVDDQVGLSTVAVVYHKELRVRAGKTCSGALVGKRTVLTAKHCFKAGTDCQIIFGRRLDDPQAQSINCKAIIGPPHDDVAIAYLVKDAPSSYKPVPYLTQKDELQVGETILLAGYGKTSWDAPDETRGTLRSTGWSQRISKFYPESKTFRYEGRGGCHGDSGGPVFIKRKDVGLTLAGIHVSGDPNCRQYGYNVDIRFLADWIEKTVAEQEHPRWNDRAF